MTEAAALQRLASASTVTDSPPTARMIHSMVTHLPAVLQPDCSAGERRFDREAARFQAQCPFRRVLALLERLREDGVYEVSSIAIVADHGYGFERSRAGGSEDPKFRRMVGAAAPNRVTVEVNGVEVGEVASTDPAPSFESYRFTVPASVLSRSPETLIGFSAKTEARLAVRTVELRPAP